MLNSLDTLTKYGASMLQQAQCYEGFCSIVEWMRQDWINKRYTPLNEQQLPALMKTPGNEVLNLHDKFMLYLPGNYLEDTKELLSIDLNQMTTYELPYNLHLNYNTNF